MRDILLAFYLLEPARSLALISFIFVTFPVFEGKLLDLNTFQFFSDLLGREGWRGEGLWPCYFLFVFVLENADHLCLSQASLQPSC